jgi:ATP-dependent RNA helicase SUPV3L1/SUV3
MQIATQRPRVIAVLGPTNTGKTYLAFERMLGHGSGIMGFPLRLLARENYDRAVKLKGERQVALITGEEKIIPPFAKYFFCTVESMPIDKKVAFLAVDEIQLAADADRGHVFTDRLLYARGEEETMFMGADTVRPLLKKLIPEAEIVTRPRFSTLSYVGSKKIQRLPPRSAVVAFTAQDVYAIAELIRRQRGGAALVMGALSPRTRNAQVALFQSGEVDYLVATDAIGMGLNMDVDHVAFASLAKFDGTFHRELRAHEFAQIAGRAGRHMSHGTFGVTGEAGEIAPEIVERIESHDFQPLTTLNWRNPVLDFRSVESLKASLQAAPDLSVLRRAQPAADERAFNDLLRDPDVAAQAKSFETVKRLWQVCQIPDFGRGAGDGHARLLAQIYKMLGERRTLPADWLAARIASLDTLDGGIDTLLQRIANIRIWTFVAHRPDWVDDHAHWQERARKVEDRLSDALHQALTQRFVDARTTTLLRRLQDRESLTAAVDAEGEVLVEGHHVGKLEGFRFVADRAEGELAGRAVSNAAFRALGSEIARRAVDLLAAPDNDLTLTDTATLLWRGAPIAKLLAGPVPLHPRIALIGGELSEGATRERIEARLSAFVAAEIANILGPLVRAGGAELSGHVRGLVYQLCEALGSIPRNGADPLIARLQKADYSTLRRNGIWVGRHDIYMPDLLKPKAARLAALLWGVHRGLREMPALPPAGRTSLVFEAPLPEGFLRAAGYRLLAGRAVRLDIVERLADAAKAGAIKGLFAVAAPLANLLGCSADETGAVLVALGYRPVTTEEGRRFRLPSHKSARTPPRKTERRRAASDSPFSKLKDLVLP